MNLKILLKLRLLVTYFKNNLRNHWTVKVICERLLNI